ncbi:MAG: hypothetical protein HY860_02725 [Chlamydiales bacterium]|nr:hypothetical protein [Chlamydiales bacterium]
MKKLLFLFCLLYFYHLQAEPTLHLISYANVANPNINNLKITAKQNHLALKIIGMHTKMENFVSRLRCVKDHLNYAGYLDDDVLLFVDAFDVVILQDKQTILDLFFSFHHPIVFGAEKYCFPDQSLATRYPTVSSKHCFLNAGGYIGYVRAIKELLNLLDLDSFQDDQLLFSTYFVSHPNEAFVLDYDCKIFLCLQLVPIDDLKLDYKQKRIYYTPQNVFPAIIHGNGNGKEIYSLLARWLTKNTTVEIKHYFKHI